MKKKRMLRSITVILGIVSFLCLGGYWLALHDIRHDYASHETWTSEGMKIPQWLPPWRSCPAEWAIASIGFWPMLAFHVFFFLSAVTAAADRARK